LHLDLLDSHAQLAELREDFSRAFVALSAAERSRAQLDSDESQRAQRADWLKFQLDELEKAAPEAGEDERLAQERRVLAAAEKLRAGAEEAEAVLAEAQAAKAAKRCARSWSRSRTMTRSWPGAKPKCSGWPASRGLWRRGCRRSAGRQRARSAKPSPRSYLRWEWRAARSPCVSTRSTKGPSRGWARVAWRLPSCS